MHPAATASNNAVDYQLLADQLDALLTGERDQVANLANAAALLNECLPDINWVGFYLVRDGGLVVGPFQGKAACVRIAFGSGVCGTAAAQRTSIVVEDVHAFEGHIACDAASRSELVVPIIVGEELIGVLDIDSPSLARFSDVDRDGIELVVRSLVRHL
jgi:GAF domain-containing protein